MYRGDDILKIYDENLIHIGFATREKVHNDGLLHQVAHVWMFQMASQNTDTQQADRRTRDTATDFSPVQYILFQQRSLHRELYAGKYDLIQTTHFDPQEHYEEAIVRSMDYYLGSKISKDNIIHVGSTHQHIQQDNYHDNALVQVFTLFVTKALFIMPDTEAIVKVRYEDFCQFVHGHIDRIPLYSLDGAFLKESTADQWWLRSDEFLDVVEPYIDTRIEELHPHTF